MTGSTASERPALDRQALLPFLPLLHVVWADGILSPAELAAFRTHVDGQDWLEPPTREALRLWLDPYDPPSPAELSELLDRIRGTELEDPEAAARSLTDLGLELARTSGAGDVATGSWSSCARASCACPWRRPGRNTGPGC